MIAIEVWVAHMGLAMIISLAMYLGFMLAGIALGFVLSTLSRRQAQRQYREWRDVSTKMKKCEQELRKWGGENNE